MAKPTDIRLVDPPGSTVLYSSSKWSLLSMIATDVSAATPTALVFDKDATVGAIFLGEC